MPTAGTVSSVTGVLSLILLTAATVAGVLVNRRGPLPGLPRRARLGLHRYLSLLAVAFLVAHVLTAVAMPLAGAGLASVVVPFAAARDSGWIAAGAVAFDLLAAITVTSLARRHLGRRLWRGVHWLAYACWPAAMAHSVGVGPGLRGGRLLAVTVICCAAFAAAVAWRVIGTRREARRDRALRDQVLRDAGLPEPGRAAGG
jgi:methionine sulfoxide reductase heme-binding subunit